MVDTGRRMHVPTTAIITDMNQPLGRMAGNAVEVNESVDALQGSGPADLMEVTLELGAELLLLTKRESSLDAAKVETVIQKALGECRTLAADRSTALVELNQKSGTRTITYRCSWFMPDYETRSKTRDEVFERLSTALGHQDLAGAEIKLA